MNQLVSAVVVAAAVAMPAISFAQQQQPLTRAEVRARLIELQEAGYSPTANDMNYPEDLLAAQARVDAEHANTSGYGAPAAGTAAVGAPAGVISPDPAAHGRKP
jgi:hypothetical protein